MDYWLENDLVMIYPVKIDVVPMLRRLVEALKPFAQSNFVNLSFASEMESYELNCHPEQVLPDLIQLLSRVITFTPSHFEVQLSVKQYASSESALQLSVVNTGVKLDHLEEVYGGLKHPVEVRALSKMGTEWCLVIKEELEQIYPAASTEKLPNNVPIFHRRLQKHLHTYTNKIKQLEAIVAQKHRQREEMFLKELNSIILSNLDREDFDVEALSRSLALSRTQLYRRLKSIVKLSPSQYIRYVRLQKAKEYLSHGEMTVGEVAFCTGFVDKSHFTRIFCKQFGVKPSTFLKAQQVKA